MAGSRTKLGHRPKAVLAPGPSVSAPPARAQSASRPQFLLEMQQTAGNQAVQQFLASHLVQPKLKVSQPGDSFEEEADRVADQVMRASAASAPSEPEEEEDAVPAVQRMCPECEEEVHRQPLEAEEEDIGEEDVVQPKTARTSSADPPPRFEDRLEELRGAGQPLSPALRNFFEPRFGRDFRDVRIHTEAQSAETARQIHARAFTFGSNVVFGAGQFSPRGTEGQRLLAHELTHVIQQGRASAPNAHTIAPLAATPSVLQNPVPVIHRKDGEESESTSKVVVGILGLFDAKGELLLEVTAFSSPTLDVEPGYYTGISVKKISAAKYEIKSGIKKLEKGELTPREPEEFEKAFRKAKSFHLIITRGIPKAGEGEKPELKPGAEEARFGKPEEAKPDVAPPAGKEEKEEAAPESAERPGVEKGEGEKPGKKEAAKPEKTEVGEKPEEAAEKEGEKVEEGETRTEKKEGTSSKYGWLGLLPVKLPAPIVKALEKALEVFGSAEEMVALREFVENLKELSAHSEKLKEVLSDPEQLLDVVLGIEDPALTPVADAIERWVERRPREHKVKKPKAKGIVALAQKVQRVLATIRSLLVPVFAARNGFQNVLEFAALLPTLPGIEEIYELASGGGSKDEIKKAIRELSDEAVTTIHKEMLEVREVFAVPAGGVSPDDLITAEALASAIASAIPKFLPKTTRPVTWVLEKTGALDWTAREFGSKLIPKAALDAINDQLRALTADVIGPVAAKAGATLDEVLKVVEPELKSAFEGVLEEIIPRHAAEDGDPAPAFSSKMLAQAVRRSAGESLSSSVRAPVEERLGADFSAVRVHHDAAAAGASSLLRAEAFALGRDIYFGPGQFAPALPYGRWLLAHELAHTQQAPAGGRLFRSAEEKAKKWIEKARGKAKESGLVAFSVDTAREKRAKKSLKAMVALIGKTVKDDKGPALPEGYKYVYKAVKKKKGAKGKPTREISGIKREVGYVLYLPPLKIDASKRIQLNLSRGFDPKSRSRAKLRAELKCTEKEQAHHIVPLELTTKHPIVKVARGAGWDINGAKDNGVCLSVGYHWGSHDKYTSLVRDRLDALDKKLGGSRDWSIIQPPFRSLITTLRSGLKAEKYDMR